MTIVVAARGSSGKRAISAHVELGAASFVQANLERSYFGVGRELDALAFAAVRKKAKSMSIGAAVV